MKIRFQYFPIITLALALIFANGCKKDLDNPKIVYGSVTDIEGNIYKTIKIGTQT